MTMLPYVPLDPSVRGRAAEAFQSDESGRGGGTLLDPGNLLGRRSQVIKDILKNNPGIASTMDENGNFDIPWNDRFFAGVNDDDIAKALALKDQRLRKLSPLGQAADDLGIEFNTLTSQSDLRTRVKDETEYQDQSKQLKAQLAGLGPDGLAASKALGDRPSIESLTATLRRVSDADPTSAKSILERDNDRERAAIIREEGKELRLERRLAQDRALQADTNRMQLQLEYARLDQADRQRAQDRQDKALMTLLQGLGNLGAAFTLQSP